MPAEKLLSISEFAKMAGTTRRTLIFYDQKGIFTPQKIAANGYRYYGYSQLYQIGFILGLRDLGLSVEEIKDYLSDDSSDALNKKLIPLREKVEQRIRNLEQILTILKQKESDNTELKDTDYYVAKKCFLPKREFWCSDFEADCSEEEIASAYSKFYQEVGAGLMTNKMLSGFLTDLPQAKAKQYANSGFRIIKEKSYDEQIRIPVITQKSCDYVAVKVENTEDGIEKGLAAIRNYAQRYQLELGNDLWQFNIGINIERLGLTKDSILAYAISNK
ncbi:MULTISPECIES: MerR family transcriptional regulator [Lactobacillus]|uniref:MerR family transcriptional regulator n=1 Tax=Lactobacillus xujianguonis TaxID=2495899 RepID=A0A437SV29_9LACO|nr:MULTISPECIES: MerR family transcriptional regulator [Lactobacillus]RVU70799.1 MerR family transcriptional regulator [Lactobacillus xujianguonis]RVU77009.1 MerR family transcriptional regulator [Lactobacillus xujianguonis]